LLLKASLAIFRLTISPKDDYMDKHLIKFVDLNAPETVAGFLANLILEKLKLGQKVLWLVPGGSALNVAVMAAKEISAKPHHNLSVTLTDERYGEIGHPSSNWQQLQDQGFLLKEAKLIPVLDGKSFIDTAKNFSNNLKKALEEADYSIGLFGIGPDGHTAGILPHSQAVSSTELAVAYDAGNFKRITVTPLAISCLNEGVVFAKGEAKWPTLSCLSKSLTLSEQPAQALKVLDSLTVFTDYKE
jgi:6-phosphogluconolactonase/glucosamine-6-phosphate isomerase/deaminase